MRLTAIILWAVLNAWIAFALIRFDNVSHRAVFLTLLLTHIVVLMAYNYILMWRHTAPDQRQRDESSASAEAGDLDHPE